MLCLSCVNWKDLAVRLMDIYCVELLHHRTSQGPPITDCGHRRGEESGEAAIFQTDELSFNKAEWRLGANSMVGASCLFKTCSQLEAN